MIIYSVLSGFAHCDNSGDNEDNQILFMYTYRYITQRNRTGNIHI